MILLLVPYVTDGCSVAHSFGPWKKLLLPVICNCCQSLTGGSARMLCTIRPVVIVLNLLFVVRRLDGTAIAICSRDVAEKNSSSEIKRLLSNSLASWRG